MKSFIFEIEKVKSADWNTKKITYFLAHVSILAESEDEAREILWNFLDGRESRISLLNG